VVSGGFHATRPLLGDFAANDIVTGTAALCTNTVFSIDGTQTGVSVGVGQNRTLWFRLDMPTASDTESTQDLTVTVTANP